MPTSWLHERTAAAAGRAQVPPHRRGGPGPCRSEEGKLASAERKPVLAGCLHWPGEVAPPPGCVPAREPETWRLAPKLAGCWPGLGSGISQGWSPEDMEFTTELGSPTVDLYVVPTSETTSLTVSIDQEWVTGPVPLQ